MTDNLNLPESFLEAGAEYYRSLRQLGLRPEVLCWAYDFSNCDHRLLMVWSGLNKYGPLKLQELLFSAYRASALPRSVDPFNVYVFGDFLKIAQALRYDWPDNAHIGLLRSRPEIIIPDINENRESADFEVRRDWIYTHQAKRHSSVKIGQDWKKFQRNVTKFAA